MVVCFLACLTLAALYVGGRTIAVDAEHLRLGGWFTERALPLADLGEVSLRHAWAGEHPISQPHLVFWDRRAVEVASVNVFFFDRGDLRALVERLTAACPGLHVDRDVWRHTGAA